MDQLFCILTWATKPIGELYSTCSARRLRIFVILGIFVFSLSACISKTDVIIEEINTPASFATPTMPVIALPTATYIQEDRPKGNISYSIVASLPHDTDAFTQGFAYSNGIFYESVGLYGQSGLRKLDGVTGELITEYRLAPQFFGEGLALVNDIIFQLTWREKTALIYDRQTLEPAGSFMYDTEGWGLTYDGHSLIMSDGSSILYYRSPETFVIEKTLQVADQGIPVIYLNELEYIEGLIFANIWKSPKVAIIDPLTGHVISWIDFRELPEIKEITDHESVLNGIAYDSETGRIWITGKNWPVIYEIQIDK